RRRDHLRAGAAGADLQRPAAAAHARVPRPRDRGGTVVRRLWRVETKAPLAVAGLNAVPVFFACLLASSLAIDRPRIVHGQEFPGTSGTEAKVWLAALIGPAIVMAVGIAALALRRYGVYAAAAAGIVVCLVLPG